MSTIQHENTKPAADANLAAEFNSLMMRGYIAAKNNLNVQQPPQNATAKISLVEKLKQLSGIKR